MKNVDIKYTEDGQILDNKFFNQLLNIALHSTKLSKSLRFQDKSYEFSDILEKLTGHKSYFIPGHAEYGEAIKGYGALGFFMGAMLPFYKELLNNPEKQLQSKKEFLLSKGFLEQEAIDNRYLQKVDLYHVALWKTYKDAKLYCPTSGSFGIAFLESIKKFRELNLTISDKTFPLFSKKDGHIVILVPDIATGKMEPDKMRLSSSLASEIDSKIKYWKTKRDEKTTYFNIKNGGFLFHTNPKSVQEITDMINGAIDINRNVQRERVDSEEALNHKTYKFLSSKMAQNAFANMGVKINIDKEAEKIDLLVEKPMIFGIAGLMVPRLKTLDFLCKNNFGKEQTYDQPSVGSTLAAASVVDYLVANKNIIDAENMEMIKELYPNLSEKLQLQQFPLKNSLNGAFDVANFGLAKFLNYDGVTYPHNNNAVNGLGALTSGDMCNMILDFMNKQETSSFYQANKRMNICPHNIMEIARVIGFIADINLKGINEAQYPESAGAAALGAWLHNQIIDKKVKAPQLARLLKENGVNKEIFFELVNKEYFSTESETHGGLMQEFSNEFVRSMNYDLRSLPKLKNIVVDKNAVTGFYNTGSNSGLKALPKIKHKILQNLENNKSSENIISTSY